MNDNRNANTPSPALDGYLVLDLATLIAGPYCATLLGDLGAEVVKIEQPILGDATRYLGNLVEDVSTLFLALNRNKKSITLSLDQPGGRPILDRLISSADVIIENFRPDVRRQYGLDYHRIREIKPDIIYLSITAFGEDGPYSLDAGTDQIFQGLSGIMTVSAEAEKEPVRIGLPIADIATSLFGAFGVTGALLRRERNGSGQLISINLLDAAISLQTTFMTEYLTLGKVPEFYATSSPFAYPVGFFKSADRYICVSVFINKFWRNLCVALDLKNLIEDRRFDTPGKRHSNRKQLEPILAERFASKSTAQWLDILRHADVPCGPINSYEAVFSDPQVIHNDLVQELEHSNLEGVRSIANPLRSDSMAKATGAAPLLGEHNETILSRLGYSEEEINEFRAKKTI